MMIKIASAREGKKVIEFVSERRLGFVSQGMGGSLLGREGQGGLDFVRELRTGWGWKRIGI